MGKSPKIPWEAFRTHKKWVKRGVILLLCVALGVTGYVMTRKNPVVTVANVVFTPPEGFKLDYAERSHTVWSYEGKDKKVSTLILNAEIRNRQAQFMGSAEEVLRECDWLVDAELYVNPNGIRMVRGFSTTDTDFPQRRYYVETGSAVALLMISENSKFYDVDACEEVILEMANNIRRK